MRTGQHLRAQQSSDALTARAHETLGVQGYREQAAIVQASLEVLVAKCAARRESLVCEGVLLSPACLHSLMARHPGVMPFLVHIRNEGKHRDRFAVRPTPSPGALTLRARSCAGRCACDLP